MRDMFDVLKNHVGLGRLDVDVDGVGYFTARFLLLLDDIHVYLSVNGNEWWCMRKNDV